MIAGIKINLIVAVSENGAIGKDNELPWRQSADLKRFKELTMGQSVIMGRKTYESLPVDLPGRSLVVMTRDHDYPAPETVSIANSVGSALSAAVEMSGQKEVWVIGGSEVFKTFLPITDVVYQTRVQSFVQGDSFFCLPPGQWELSEEEGHKADNKNEYDYVFQVYHRTTESRDVHTSRPRGNVLGAAQEGG